jgi:hypothetical protein
MRPCTHDRGLSQRVETNTGSIRVQGSVQLKRDFYCLSADCFGEVANKRRTLSNRVASDRHLGNALTEHRLSGDLRSSPHNAAEPRIAVMPKAGNPEMIRQAFPGSPLEFGQLRRDSLLAQRVGVFGQKTSGFIIQRFCRVYARDEACTLYRSEFSAAGEATRRAHLLKGTRPSLEISVAVRR